MAGADLKETAVTEQGSASGPIWTENGDLVVTHEPYIFLLENTKLAARTCRFAPCLAESEEQRNEAAH